MKMLTWPDHRTTLISTLSLVKLIKLPMRRPLIFVNSTGIRSNGSQKDGHSTKVNSKSKRAVIIQEIKEKMILAKNPKRRKKNLMRNQKNPKRNQRSQRRKTRMKNQRKNQRNLRRRRNQRNQNQRNQNQRNQNNQRNHQRMMERNPVRFLQVSGLRCHSLAINGVQAGELHQVMRQSSSKAKTVNGLL